MPSFLKKRWVKIGLVCIGLLFLWVFLMKWLFSDQHLKYWVEKKSQEFLDTKVQCERVSFRFLHGFRFYGCSIAALKGSKNPLGYVKEVTFQWKSKSLLKAVFEIEKIHIVGVKAFVEDTKNVDTVSFLKNRLGSNEEDPKEKKPEKTKSKHPFVWPVHVVVSDVRLQIDSVTYETDALKSTLTDLGLYGFLEGYKKNTHISLVLKSSDSDKKEKQGMLRVVDLKKDQNVVDRYTMNISVDHRNDRNTVWSVLWDNEFYLHEESKHPLSLVVKGKGDVNIEAQSFQAHGFDLRYAKNTFIRAVGHTVQKKPVVLDVSDIQSHIDLKEISLLTQIIRPDILLEGTVDFSGNVHGYDVSKPFYENETSSNIAMGFNDISVCEKQFCAVGFNGKTHVNMSGGSFLANALWDVKNISYEKAVLKRPSLKYDIRINRIKDFLQGIKNTLQVDMVLKNPEITYETYGISGMVVKENILFGKDFVQNVDLKHSMDIKKITFSEQNIEHVAWYAELQKNKEHITVSKNTIHADNNLDFSFLSRIKIKNNAYLVDFFRMDYAVVRVGEFFKKIPFLKNGSYEVAQGFLKGSVDVKGEWSRETSSYISGISFEDKTSLYGNIQNMLNHAVVRKDNRIDMDLFLSDMKVDDHEQHVWIENIHLDLELNKGVKKAIFDFNGSYENKEHLAKGIKNKTSLDLSSDAFVFDEELHVLLHENKTNQDINQNIDVLSHMQLHADQTFSVKDLSFFVKNKGFLCAASVDVENIWDLFDDMKDMKKGFRNTSLTSHVSVVFEKDENVFLDDKNTALKGKAAWVSDIDMKQSRMRIDSFLKFDAFDFNTKTLSLEQMSGLIPLHTELSFEKNEKHLLLDGVSIPLYFVLDEDRDSDAYERLVYFDKTKPYLKNSGIRIAKAKKDGEELRNIVLNGYMHKGTLVVNEFSWFFLGGDVDGHMFFKVSSDKKLSGNTVVRASNIDASYFSGLNLKPGKSSELSADFNMDFVFSESSRDINMDMNVTRIGRNTLDRFLMVLDPEEKDPSIQNTRKKLKFIRIDGISAWVRYEQLNMDLFYTALFRIPGTQLGWRPVDREILRRYSLTETLDVNLQPKIKSSLGPFLGWSSND